MDERTEGHAVTPARGKVLDIDVLTKQKVEGKKRVIQDIGGPGQRTARGPAPPPQEYTHIISPGLGAAPVQEHLFDAVGIGNPKASRALDSHPGDRWIGRAAGRTCSDINRTTQLGHCVSQRGQGLLSPNGDYPAPGKQTTLSYHSAHKKLASQFLLGGKEKSDRNKEL